MRRDRKHDTISAIGSGHRRAREKALWNGQSYSFLPRRLRVGWGSLRVAVGMGVGQEVYDVAKEYLDNHNSDWY